MSERDILIVVELVMEDQVGEGHQHQQQQETNGGGNQQQQQPQQGPERSEPVRSRWTPKPEQILILESIFNSGMVNPPKEETIRIRKLLEKFGSVGDANVFYWFQNRRSRSRRRQRQMQASMEQRNNQLHHHPPPQLHGGATIATTIYDSHNQSHTNNSSSSSDPVVLPPVTTLPFPPAIASPSSFTDLSGSSSSSCGMLGSGQEALDGLFNVASQMGFPEFDHSPAAAAYTPSSFNYHSGKLIIACFINTLYSFLFIYLFVRVN